MTKRILPMNYIYRVAYRRWGWSGEPTHRVFLTAAGAQNFVAKLTSDGRPDLAPLDLLAVHRAPRGAWTDITSQMLEGGR